MQNENRKIKTFAVVVFLIVAAFGFGVVAGNQNTTFVPSVSEGDDTYDEEYLRSIYEIVKQKYLGDLPASSDLTYEMTKGIVNSLGDKYSAFLTPEEATSYFDSNDSAFEGIGVQLGYDGSYTTVESPMPGYPGAEAGLLPGDLILEVDGEDIAGVRPEIAVTKIRGTAGTVVKLLIYRESEARAFEVEITRSRIDLDNISYEDLGNGTVMISIVKFTEGEEGSLSGIDVFKRDWRDMVDEVAGLDPKNIILDLRSNPGGFVNAATYVAEEFLSDGAIILKEQEKDVPETEYTDQRTGKLEDVNLVVLVNAASASASEILASAIQDNDRGEIIGTKTTGKGVEQELLPLSDDSLLIITIRKWLRPDGSQISKENPITPDVEVEYVEADGDNENDSQVQKALEILSTL